jgi:DNA polymerase-3 subunit delta'
MDIVGHNHIEKHFTAACQQGVLTQSYLFCGPEAVGKYQVALDLSYKATGVPDFVPSEQMPTPQDVFVLAPTEETKKGVTKKKGIAAEDLREALHFLQEYPSQGQYRVLIIRDAHMLSSTAQNVLLKTLEEPPSSALIFLVTHEPEVLLATVHSRVTTEVFSVVPEAALAERYTDDWLKEAGIPVFFRSLGRPGVLEWAQEHPEQFVGHKEDLAKLYGLSALTTAERLALAERLAVGPARAAQLIEWWIPGLRAQALRAEGRGAGQYYKLLEKAALAARDLKTRQLNARLILETLFLSLR